jgi:hypothetical protein
MSTKDKGDVLENLIEKICSSTIRDAAVTRNAVIKGRLSNTNRDIDVLLVGKIGPFETKIAIEAKNYSDPVGIEKVEALKQKLSDVGIDLGVMICPKGFTQPAKNLAQSTNIQLFEIFHEDLQNTNLFLPLRYIDADPKGFSFTVRHRAIGSTFSLPIDVTLWRFHVDGTIITAKQLVTKAWNEGKIPQRLGVHNVALGAVVISDVARLDQVQYIELDLQVDVKENYYLKLFPASFFRDTLNGKEEFHLKIDAYSKEEDMLKHGWKKFASLEELNQAANINNQPKGIKNLIIKPEFTFGSEEQIEK